MRVNNYSPQTRNSIYFGHNQGALNTIEKLKTRVTSEGLNELQAHLQDIEFTPDFIKQIKELTEHWKKVMVKYAPDEIQEKLSNIFGMK